MANGKRRGVPTCDPGDPDRDGLASPEEALRWWAVGISAADAGLLGQDHPDPRHAKLAGVSTSSGPTTRNGGGVPIAQGCIVRCTRG